MRMKISLLGKATYFGFQSMWTQASLIVIISQLGDRPLLLITAHEGINGLATQSE